MREAAPVSTSRSSSSRWARSNGGTRNDRKIEAVGSHNNTKLNARNKKPMVVGKKNLILNAPRRCAKRSDCRLAGCGGTSANG